MRCLERRRDELAALLAVFADADERTVLHALEASEALTPAAACVDLDAARDAHGEPDEPRLREPVARLRADLDRARALRLAGHYDDALALARVAHDEAVRLGHVPARAETGLLLGSLLGLRGGVDEATAALEQAFLDGLAGDQAEVAAWAAISAAHVVGFLAHRGAEGRRWGALAEALLPRIDGDPRAAASLYANLGNIAVAEGALDEARARFEAALDIAESSLGRDHVLVANTAANLAAVLRRSGDYPGALALYARVRETLAARLGTSHPGFATLVNNHGALLQVMGDLEGAARSYREVLALADGALSPTSPTLGHAHNNLAEVLLARGDPAAAVPHVRAAIDTWSAAHGPRHPLVGQAQLALGRLHVELAEPDAALQALQTALELLRDAGAAPATIAAAQFELARALALAHPDDLGEAIAAAQAAAAALDPGETRDAVLAWLSQRAGP
nr:tetratricopeptide repeat protein [Nannocystis pusilla]